MLKIFITMIFLALGSFAYVFSGLPDAQDMNPVSYTHLDVYKRQAQ